MKWIRFKGRETELMIEGLGSQKDSKDLLMKCSFIDTVGSFNGKILP